MMTKTKIGRVLITGAGGLLGPYVVAELKNVAEIVGLDIASPKDPADFVIFYQGSIEDVEAVGKAVQGCDAVIHIAARPNQWSGEGHQIIQTNVTGTWNVLQAAEDAGVKRVVITSSDSVIGFTVLHGSMTPPDYLPIDVEHPLRPSDPYALSKVLCERMARMFVERGKLEVTVLRPCYVLYPEFECEVISRAANPGQYVGPDAGGRQPAGGGVMWHYIDPRDLARAYRLAIEADEPKFGPYFIVGPNTLAPDPTVERLAKNMKGERVPINEPDLYETHPFASLYDMKHPLADLGFEARHDRRSEFPSNVE